MSWWKIARHRISPKRNALYNKKVVQKSLLLWEKGDHEVVDEELILRKNTSSVGFAATFPYWGRLIREFHLCKLLKP